MKDEIMQLIREDVVIRRLSLDVGRQARAQRLAMDRMRERVQEIRRETGAPILSGLGWENAIATDTRPKSVEELIRTLLSSN